MYLRIWQSIENTCKAIVEKLQQIFSINTYKDMRFLRILLVSNVVYKTRGIYKPKRFLSMVLDELNWYYEGLKFGGIQVKISPLLRYPHCVLIPNSLTYWGFNLIVISNYFLLLNIQLTHIYFASTQNIWMQLKMIDYTSGVFIFLLSYFVNFSILI